MENDSGVGKTNLLYSSAVNEHAHSWVYEPLLPQNICRVFGLEGKNQNSPTSNESKTPLAALGYGSVNAVPLKSTIAFFILLVEPCLGGGQTMYVGYWVPSRSGSWSQAWTGRCAAAEDPELPGFSHTRQLYTAAGLQLTHLFKDRAEIDSTQDPVSQAAPPAFQGQVNVCFNRSRLKLKRHISFSTALVYICEHWTDRHINNCLTDYINYTELSPSWGTSSHYATQVFLKMLWNPNVNQRV
jgi:hypothetical protein